MLKEALLLWNLFLLVISESPVNIATLGREAEVPLFQIHGPIDPNKPNITMIASGTFGGNIYPMGSLYDQGIKIAVEALANKAILSDFNLIVNFYDEQCEDALGVRIVRRRN